MAQIDLTEPVWREDIEKEVEYLQEGCRSLAAFFHRAQAQGAPQELLSELAAVYQYLDAAQKKLGVLPPCFHPEPTYSDGR